MVYKFSISDTNFLLTIQNTGLITFFSYTMVFVCSLKYKHKLLPQRFVEIQKDLKNAEKKIEKLEADISRLEDLMAEPGFYETDNADKKLSEYDSKKSSLTKAMAVWEAAALKLDQLD